MYLDAQVKRMIRKKDNYNVIKYRVEVEGLNPVKVRRKRSLFFVFQGKKNYSRHF